MKNVFEKMNTESQEVMQKQKVERKPLEERKTERICIYVTKAQKEAIERKAFESYMKLPDFIIKQALKD